MDSRRWEGFKPRDSDIVIATFHKSGTTWTQRIVDLLVFQSPAVRPVGSISPWLDATIFRPLGEELANLEAQTHRRFIKSHLPFDALPVWDTVKYIHVARDGRDACLSWHNHLAGVSDELRRRVSRQAAELAATTEGAPPLSSATAPSNPRDYLVQWMDELETGVDEAQGLEYFGFETTFWRERARPNLLMVHYNDMIADLAAEMRRISDFLEIDTPARLMPQLVEAAGFQVMKKDGDALLPNFRTVFDRGADRFLNSGRSGRWREYATAEDTRRYEALARKMAAPSLAAWLEHGRLGAGEPRASAE
jgi:aryl sulfotransferase